MQRAAVERQPGQAGGAPGEQVSWLVEATPASWLWRQESWHIPAGFG